MTLKRKIALVDLDRQKITLKTIPDQWRNRFLGGRGIGDYLLWQYGAMDCDALGANNTIVVNAGLLGGTLVAPHGCGSILAKSPLSGFLTCTSLKGPFAAEMRWAGFDHVVIRGRSKRPVVLFINNGNIEIRDAVQLWGLTTRETRQAILQDFNDREIKTCQIGPAGENLVRYATVMTDRYESTGSSGLGAVLGAKRIKALVCRGTGDLEVKSPAQSLACGPQVTLDKPDQPGGTAVWYDDFTVSDTTREMIATKAMDQGMDAMLLTGMLRWAAHLFEQGVIDRRHTRGLALNRLDETNLLALTDNIALRRNVGRLLGEGPLRAASKLGFKHLPAFAPVPGLLAVYANGASGAIQTLPGDAKINQNLWQLPNSPGRVALQVLHDLISGCLGIDNLSPLPELEDIQAMIRLNTGLSLDGDRLLSIAYRCHALERLYNIAAASAYRKQNETELNLGVPASFRLEENWGPEETLNNMRKRMDRHCKANGWTHKALVKKRVFELLEITDLWGS